MKRILNILGIVFLIGHFTLIFIYCMPKNDGLKGSKIEYVSTGYTYPMYDQRWNLFAPAPKTNYRFKFRYKDVDSTWSSYSYPIQEYNDVKNKFSGTSHGRHVLAEYYTAYWIHAEIYRLFGLQYKSQLQKLENEQKFKKSYSSYAYEQYMRFYIPSKSGRIVEGVLEIEDVTTGIVEEVKMPEFIYE